jgi:thioredoxin-dependent peroxiredoxin
MAAASTPEVVRVGDPAPDFTLLSADGSPVSLSDFRGKSEIVLFFYPGDYSPVCTAEACSFRDNYEAFQEAGAQVIGVSGDSSRSHEGFARRFRLPFLLLSDSDGALRARFGVPKTLGMFPGRVTYLIDRGGVVRHIFASQFQPWKHVDEALRVLKAMRAQG